LNGALAFGGHMRRITAVPEQQPIRSTQPR
jgi:hypothetical protein